MYQDSCFLSRIRLLPEEQLSSFISYAYIGGHIYKSINGGLNWISLGQSPSDWWWINGFNSSNIERDKIFVGGMELFKSLNGGNDWELINLWWEYYDDIDSKLHADIPEIRFFRQ